MRDWREQVVVMTGASSSIGREMAKMLGGKRAQLVLVARRAAVLEDLKAEIEAAGGLPPLVVGCDVEDVEQVESLRVQVEDRWGAADVLVNNAGRGAYGPFAAADIRICESVVQTNLLGVIYCTRTFLPAMLKRGRGRLVFISSIVAELPSPGHAVYSATKCAVSVLAESLDYELAPGGISVHVVEPGLVRSEFAQQAGMPAKRFEQMPSKSAAEIARAIVRAVEAGKSKSVPDAKAHLAIKMRRHFPRLARFVFKRVFRRF